MDVEEADVAGRRVTVVGHKHPYPEQLSFLGKISFINDLIYSNDFDEVLDRLEKEMENADQFAWEYPGYEKRFEEGSTRIWPSTGSEYIDRTLEMASENFDEIWGPDSKNIDLYGYVPAAGMAPLAAGTGYKIKKSDWEAGFDSDLDLSISRRELLIGLPAPVSLWSMGLTDFAQPEKLEESLDKTDTPYSINYNDIREVFISEGISQIMNEMDGDVLAAFGEVHTSSIKNYLEDEEARRSKIEFYKDILPENNQRMTRWEDRDSYWLLADSQNLA